MEWVAELFERCSEILKLRELSDGEKIGYILALSQAESCVPSSIPLVDKAHVIREYYHDKFDETGA